MDDRQKGSRAAFREVFGFDALVVGQVQQLENGDSACGHVDCTAVGLFMFPGPCVLGIGLLCADHKLAGMIHKDDADITAQVPSDPDQPSPLNLGEFEEHMMFSWDDTSDAALHCNAHPAQVDDFIPAGDSLSDCDTDDEESGVASTSTNPAVPDFHHCSKHVKNNLLAKFKYGTRCESTSAVPCTHFIHRKRSSTYRRLENFPLVPGHIVKTLSNTCSFAVMQSTQNTMCTQTSLPSA